MGGGGGPAAARRDSASRREELGTRGLWAPGGPGTVLPGAARGPGAARPWAPSRDLHGRRTPALGTSTSRCKWRQQEAKEGSVPERLPCDAVVVTKSDCDTFLVSSAGCALIPLSDRPATPSAEGHTCWGARGQGPLPAAWGNSPPGPACWGGRAVPRLGRSPRLPAHPALGDDAQAGAGGHGRGAPEQTAREVCRVRTWTHGRTRASCACDGGRGSPWAGLQ